MYHNVSEWVWYNLQLLGSAAFSTWSGSSRRSRREEEQAGDSSSPDWLLCRRLCGLLWSQNHQAHLTTLHKSRRFMWSWRWDNAIWIYARRMAGARNFHFERVCCMCVQDMQVPWIKIKTSCPPPPGPLLRIIYRLARLIKLVLAACSISLCTKSRTSFKKKSGKMCSARDDVLLWFSYRVSCSNAHEYEQSVRHVIFSFHVFQFKTINRLTTASCIK